MPDELKHRVSGDVVTLSFGSPASGAKAELVLAGHPEVKDIAADGASLRLSVSRGEQALPALLRTLDGAGLTLESVQLARPTLDDVFLTLTGRSLRDDSPVQPGREPELAGTAS